MGREFGIIIKIYKLCVLSLSLSRSVFLLYFPFSHSLSRLHQHMLYARSVIVKDMLLHVVGLCACLLNIVAYLSAAVLN